LRRLKGAAASEQHRREPVLLKFMGLGVGG